MKSDMKLTNRQGENLDFSLHEGEKEGVLVLLGHGLTGNKDRPLLVALAEKLAQRGWPSLRFSYSGNGSSGGDFGEATISKEVEDLRSIIAAFPDKKIAYVGHSMGGAVGVLTAAAEPRLQVLVTLAGMVYTKNFVNREFDDLTPGRDVMWEEENCPLSQKFVDDLTYLETTLDVAGEIKQPWLLAHGREDDVIPLLDSDDALAAAKCEARLIVYEGAGHSFSEAEYDDLAEQIDAWLTLFL